MNKIIGKNGRYIEDLTGVKFGRLTAVTPDLESEDKNTRWICKCDCGKTGSFQVTRLKNGKNKSCGCISRVKDRTGEKYGKLTAIEFIGLDNNSKALWRCKCECGNEKVVVGTHLTDGSTKSCGCLSVENFNEFNKKNNPAHKYKNMNLKFNSGSRLYKIFMDMKKRCLNPNEKNYHNYGERGISVCDEWTDKNNGYLNFYNWAMNNGYDENLTLDRIDVNGNYTPENCRWATWKEQSNNKRNNKKINIKDKQLTISEFCNIYPDTDRSLVLSAIDTVGNNLEDILEYIDKKTSVYKNYKFGIKTLSLFEEELTIPEICEKYKIPKPTIYRICQRNNKDKAIKIIERKIIRDKAIIFVIMAKSGSGKDTIANIVSKELNIPILVSHSSRKQRENEVNGKEYYFVENDFFKKEKDNFIDIREYKVYDGSIWRYGIHKNELKNKKISLAIADLEGCKNIEKYMGKDKVIRIFIDVNKEERIRRLHERGDIKEEIIRRVNDDDIRFKSMYKYSDLNIVNNEKDIRFAVDKVKSIILNKLSELEI